MYNDCVANPFNLKMYEQLQFFHSSEWLQWTLSNGNSYSLSTNNIVGMVLSYWHAFFHVVTSVMFW